MGRTNQEPGQEFQRSSADVFLVKTESESTHRSIVSVPSPNKQDNWSPRAGQLQQPHKHHYLLAPLSLMSLLV
ncbi:hypothetical protein DPMN_055856 [Dreissena polymorpha]|uniref:Uncharacterized protein n=1 Tax=Dreissena polymorpha TaxID=45954 RepID=A0A9D4CT76_DREPO|nr:hypothetical protein DPMN_055856 [Dreissena polymorpha]